MTVRKSYQTKKGIMAITSKNIQDIVDLIEAQEAKTRVMGFKYNVTRGLTASPYVITYGGNKIMANLSSKECYYFLCGVLAERGGDPK